MFNNGDNIALSYYAKPSLDAFFIATYEVVEGGQAGAAFLLVVLVLVCAALLRGRVERRAASAQSIRGGVVGSLKLRIVLIALCFLPPTAFAFSVFVTKSFSARYMAVGALIPAIAVPWVLDMLPWRRATTVAIVPLVAAMLVLRAQAPHPIAQAMAVLTKAAPPLAIVVGEGLLYIELDGSGRSRHAREARLPHSDRRRDQSRSDERERSHPPRRPQSGISRAGRGCVLSRRTSAFTCCRVRTCRPIQPRRRSSQRAC